MELHRLCAVFPPLQGADFQALVEDVRAHGLRNAIVTFEGKILDGQNRFRACEAAGVRPLFTAYSGADPVAYVEAQNLHRRHLTPEQRAAAVAALQNWAQAAAKGGDGSNQHSSKPTTVSVCSPVTVSDRAAKAGVHANTQRKADTVARANPELAAQVARGEVKLSAAVQQVTGKPVAKRAAPVVHWPERQAVPAPEPEPQPWDDAGAPSLEELMETERAHERDIETMQRICEADDKLAEARKILAQRDALIEQLQWRVNGLVNENGELIRMVKSLRRRIEKAAA